MLRASLLATAFALALAPACKPKVGAGEDTSPSVANPEEAPVALPAPHPLEDTPPVGAYVRDPAAALDVAIATLPGVPPLVNVAALVIATKAPADLAEALASKIAPREPWVGARVADEDILHLPLLPAELDAAWALLEPFPAAGDFGAVSLPPAGIDIGQLAEGAPDPDADMDSAPADSAKPQLAWIDRDTSTLTIAETLPGLVTGRELARGYASQPVWFTVDASVVQEFTDVFPYDRITAQGPGLDDLTITIDADPERGLPASADLAPGALTNLHSGSALAIGASTRWAKHEPEVRTIIREINRQVEGSGFAAKIMLEPLAQQAITVLRSWNGRIFAGLGPKRHLAVGLGADDPRKAAASLNRFLRSAIDNLELARMFVSNVPKISLRRHSAKPEINVVTVKGAKKMLPKGAAPLFDERGSLSIAYSHSAKSGAVFAMIGPEPETAIASWASAIERAAPASEAEGDLIAATVALSPEQLQTLLSQADPNDANALIEAGIDLTAGRPPTQLVIRQEASRYVVTSKGPAPVREGQGGGS